MNYSSIDSLYIQTHMHDVSAVAQLVEQLSATYIGVATVLNFQTALCCFVVGVTEFIRAKHKWVL